MWNITRKRSMKLNNLKYIYFNIILYLFYIIIYIHDIYFSFYKYNDVFYIILFEFIGITYIYIYIAGNYLFVQ